MARRRYDRRWKEVQIINGYCMLMTYLEFVIRGIGFLVVTWITVVLLGGFVSMIDKSDFLRLMLITLIQILWINASFLERADSSFYLLSSQKTVKDLYMRKWQLTGNTGGGHTKLAVVKRVVAAVRPVVGWVLALLHSALLLLCILFPFCLFLFGQLITTWLSIYGLVKQHYRGMDDDSKNIYPAHNVLYVLCVVQGAMFLYILVLGRWMERIVNKVSQEYGFQDGGRAVSDYADEIQRGCRKKPSSARERNLITYAIELMESKSPSSRLSGTLILDRLLMRQYSGQIKAPTLIKQEENQQQRQKQLELEDNAVAQLIKKTKKMKEEWKYSREERKKRRESRKKRQQREEAIIAKQRTVIRRLIGSPSSIHILQKLLDTLDSKRSHDRSMREAAARIVAHVAGGIRLKQFPQGINCISSLISNFEDYRRLQPDESSSSASSTNEETATVIPLFSNTNGNNGDDQEHGSYSSSESESEQESEQASEYSDSEPEPESYNGINRPSSSKAPNGYKDLVMSGLSILWSLAGSEDNCIIISNTKHLVSKIMAPVSYDLVHRTHHSPWSTRVVDASMRVMLRLMATAKDIKGATWDDMHHQISNDEEITSMVKILTCEECKDQELQITAMQILMQLKGHGFTRKLIDFFSKGDRNNISIRKTADKELVLLFLGNKNVACFLYNEKNYEFVGGLAEIVSQVENDAEARKSAAEILEHMCIHYTENDEYLSTLKNAMAGAMPKVLRELLLCGGLTEEQENTAYFRNLDSDIESQDAANGRTTNNKKNSDNTCTSPWQNQHHKLYVAMLSLYVTACEKLDLDIDVISPGEGDQGEGVAFRFAKRIVESNKDRVSADSLTLMKLSTRMVIATMIKQQGTRRRVVNSAELESLMDSLSRVRDTMLDLEGSMVFSVGTTTTVPATTNTLDCLMEQAQEFQRQLALRR